MQNLVSETDIREKILVPWLKEIGISVDMVKMEYSFTIQLGRGIYEVNSKKQRDSGAGSVIKILLCWKNTRTFYLHLNQRIGLMNNSKYLFFHLLKYIRI